MRYLLLTSCKVTFFLFALVSAVAAQDQVPAFGGADLQTGQQYSLEDFKGRVVFLDFWASWCPPCLVSLPAYQRMRDSLVTEPFEVVAINVDAKLEDGLDFLADADLTYPILADKEGIIGKPMRVRGLPVSFLLDRDGRIVKRYTGYEPGDEDTIKRDIQKLLATGSLDD